MKRLLKWLFLILLLPPLALFAILWVLIEVTPQAKLRALAAQELGRKMNREVGIGPIHLGLRGLAIDEIRLSEIPNFHAGTFMTAKGIRLGWDLRSIWEGLNIRKKFVTRSDGRFHIDEFLNPHYSAKDFSLTWSLSDMDPSWSHVTGGAKLEQGAGFLQNIDRLMATSPSAKIALTPILALMNLERMGVLKLGLPDLRRWPIQGIHGVYTFHNGCMTIKRFRIESPQLEMGATGTVELGSGALLLDVQLHVPPTPGMGAMDATLRVSGTTSNPKVDVSSLKKKAFQAALGRLLQNPQGVKKNIDQTLKNLFR